MKRPFNLPLVPVNSNPVPILTQVFSIVAGASIGWAALASFYTYEDGRIITGWLYEVHQQSSTEDVGPILSSRQNQATLAFEHASRAPKGQTSFGALALSLELPKLPLTDGDFAAATRAVCADQASTLSFYVSTPYKRLEVAGVFSLEVRKDGAPLWTLDLPAANAPLYFELPWSARADCSPLEFRLVSRVTNSAESWQKASRVEIIFPRLQKQP